MDDDRLFRLAEALEIPVFKNVDTITCKYPFISNNYYYPSNRDKPFRFSILGPYAGNTAMVVEELLLRHDYEVSSFSGKNGTGGYSSEVKITDANLCWSAVEKDRTMALVEAACKALGVD